MLPNCRPKAVHHFRRAANRTVFLAGISTPQAASAPFIGKASLLGAPKGVWFGHEGPGGSGISVLERLERLVVRQHPEQRGLPRLVTHAPDPFRIIDQPSAVSLLESVQ